MLLMSVVLGLAAPAESVPSIPKLYAPETLLVGNRPNILASGLHAREQVTIEAYRLGPSPTDENGKSIGSRVLLRASATFKADRSGQVVVDSAVPLTGTYAGADPRGLLWSGRPVTSPPEDDAIVTPKSREVQLVLRRGNQVLARRLLTFAPAPNLVVERIDTPSLVGVFAAPSGGSRRPVVIALHGSEGGSWAAAEAQARLFAARGYASLALIYFAWPYNGIPNATPSFTNLPVERLASARDWLIKRPEADTSKLGLWGASKGSEFALLAAANYPWVKAVVACVPSSLLWGGFGTEQRGLPGFTVNGRAPSYVPYGDYGPVMRKEITSTERHVRDRTSAGPAKATAAMIPIERSAAKILLLSGGADSVWPSSAMSAEIVARRKASNRQTKWLNFPLAGHYICGTGDQPTRDATGGDSAQAGGTASAAGAANSRAWDATVQFLSQSLK